MAASQQTGPLAFKRVYVDLPPDTHERLKQLAHERGKSAKGLLAELIDAACNSSTTKRKRK